MGTAADLRRRWSEPNRLRLLIDGRATTMGSAHAGPHRGARVDQLRIFAGRIADCVFDSASLLGMRLWGTEVIDSTFGRADLRSSALGTGEWRGRRDTWRRVDFSRANLRDVTFTAAILDRCTFEKTSKGLRFIDSEIHDCAFSGQLGELVIDGRGHRYLVDTSALSADFGNATVSDFSITGYRVGSVVLPPQDDLVVVHNYPSVVRAACLAPPPRCI